MSTIYLFCGCFLTQSKSVYRWIWIYVPAHQNFKSLGIETQPSFPNYEETMYVAGLRQFLKIRQALNFFS